MCSTWAFTLAADTALTTFSSDILSLVTPVKAALCNSRPQRLHLAAN
jgi:hypothetical protein